MIDIETRQVIVNRIQFLSNNTRNILDNPEPDDDIKYFKKRLKTLNALEYLFTIGEFDSAALINFTDAVM